MKKLSVILLVLIALISFPITGCERGVYREQQNEADMSFKEKMQLEFWALSDSSQVLKAAIEDYKEVNPNIEIKLTTRAIDPHKEALKVAAVSGTLPDMWFNWGGSLGSYFPANGLTMDLTEYAKNNHWAEKYVLSSLSFTSLADQISGVPVHMYGLGVFYRKDIFQKYNIKVPATFKEFEGVMKTLKEHGITPISTGGKGGWHPMRLVQGILEHIAGPKEHDELMSMEKSWDSEAVINTYKKWNEWYKKGYLQDRFLTLDPEETKISLYEGKAAMILEGPWFDQTLSRDQQDLNLYGFFPFPTDQTPSRISGFVEIIQIKKQSSKEKQNAALEFVEFLTSKEETLKRAHFLGTPSALENVSVSHNLPHMPYIEEALQKGVYQIADQALPQEVVATFFKVQDAVIIGEITPETAAKSMQAAIETYKNAVK